jgi:predicted RNA-binding protein YlqC (UPF0109 family)
MRQNVGEKKIEVIRKKTTVSAVVSVRPKEDVKNEILACLNLALKNILASPEHLQVRIEEGEKTTIFELDIAQSDFGRVLGAKGKTIGALRTIVLAMAAVHNFRGIIRIKDEDRFF